jgi:O-antigen/teichoic acid export membrane protein
VPVISLKLGVACFRSVRVEADASKKTDIIKTILVFSAFYHLILLLFLWLISPYFELNYKFPFLIIVFLSSFFTILGSIARSLYNRKALIFSGIVNSIGILIFSSLLFYLGKKGIEPIIYANILMNCLTISILIFSLKLPKIILGGLFNPHILKDSLHFSLPLIPNVLSRWFVNLANRYIIAIFLGIGSNGIFAVATKIPAIISVFSSIFFTVLQDIAFTDKKNRKDDAYYGRLFKKLFIFQVASSLVILAFSKQLTHLLFAPEYAETYRYLPLILAGSLFTNFADFWGVFYQLEKKTLTILNTNIFGAVINCFVTLIFIKHIGLFAPALGTMLGFLTMWLMRMKSEIVHRKFDLPLKLIIQFFGIFLLFSLLILIENSYLTYTLMIASIGVFVYTVMPIVMSWKKSYFVKKQSF